MDRRETEDLHIYDLGSQDVNGSYRPLFSEPSWHYVGLDMAAGQNVDVVLQTPYAWKEIASQSADVVVSGQAFEHIQYFWITMLEVARVLKPGGICCILAPSSGPEHRYPLDCWRFYPDGMASLAHFAQMEVLEVSTEWEDKGYMDGSDWWHDSMLVCRKPDNGTRWNMKSALKRWLQHRAMTIGMR
jgi:SAM-dependent methyltransferase